MTSVAASLRKLVFGIPFEEAAFARRGFHCDEKPIRDRLERVGQTFIAGYSLALSDYRVCPLAARLDQIDAEWRGFAYEGAAMGLTLLDFVAPWKRRLAEFLRGPGDAHIYMVHVGIGWAFARLPVNVNRSLNRLDPLLGWLAVDGYGFHEGYFHWRRYFEEGARPKRLAGYAARVFDQGLGRSLWFIKGANPALIHAAITKLDPSRHSDLWSGVGLAAAYAGGISRRALETLRHSAGKHASNIAQGAAFAAKARQRASNPAEHTDLACRIFCGVPAEMAASVTDDAIPHGAHQELPEYEIWRLGIQSRFAVERAAI